MQQKQQPDGFLRIINMTKDEFIKEWKYRTVEIHIDYNPVMLTINTIRKVACISTIGFDTLYLIHNGYMIYIYNSLSAFAQAFADPAIDSCFLKFRINSIEEFWDLLK